jgi:hypothetical protein
LLLEDEEHERILFAIVDDDDGGVVVVVIVVLDIDDISRCAKVDKMEKLFSTFCIIVRRVSSRVCFLYAQRTLSI